MKHFWAGWWISRFSPPVIEVEISNGSEREPVEFYKGNIWVGVGDEAISFDPRSTTSVVWARCSMKVGSSRFWR